MAIDKWKDCFSYEHYRLSRNKCLLDAEIKLDNQQSVEAANYNLLTDRIRQAKSLSVSYVNIV